MIFPQRKSHRLKNYDYSQNGYYFITICTNNHKHLLCNIVGNDALVVPTSIGQKVIDCWLKIQDYNSNIIIDKFCLMPNHFHGVLIIQNNTENHTFDFQITERRGRRSLQDIIKDFKSITTRLYKKEIKNLSSLWQKSFYDEIIRDCDHYKKIWNYIDNNPLKWSEDKYYSP